MLSPDGITRTYNTATANTLTLPTGALPGRYDVAVTATANGFQYTTAAPAPGTFVVVPQAPIAVAINVGAPVAPQTSFFEGNTVTLTGVATEPGSGPDEPVEGELPLDGHGTERVLPGRGTPHLECRPAGGRHVHRHTDGPRLHRRIGERDDDVYRRARLAQSPAAVPQIPAPMAPSVSGRW